MSDGACLVSIMIELKREMKASSTAKRTNCTAEYDRAEANIEALYEALYETSKRLNDEEVFDRAWDAAFNRKVEVYVYDEDFKALLLQISVPIGTTVRALKAAWLSKLLTV